MQKMFLTLFYSGLSPKAPGTVGSFVALILGLLVLQYFPPSTLALATIFISVVAVKEINKYEAKVGEHDSKEIVIDELVGMWLALAISGATIEQAILSFVCFRFFDIYKPSIIGRIDRDVKGGLGVVGDDLLAGLFGGILSALIYQVAFM
jgi:phosphatidylglycerophosphatase A